MAYYNRPRLIISPLVLLSILFQHDPLSVASAEDLVPDLGAVEGMQYLPEGELLKPKLKENGFVVGPKLFRQVFSPYVKSKLPPFVTVDSLILTHHALLLEQVKAVESHFAGQINEFTNEMIKSLQSSGGKLPVYDDPEAASYNLRLLHLGAALLGAKAAGASLDETRELELINAASTEQISPLTGLRIDYKRFAPRGLYMSSRILEQYFRCMQWYAQAFYPVNSADKTKAAAAFAAALRANGRAAEIWQHFDSVFTSLLGPTDDLSPLQYADALGECAKTASVVPVLACLDEKLNSLPGPRINSAEHSGQENADSQKKGMRIFGKRYIPESELFMYMTAPALPGRILPSGLDVMAALGSPRAEANLRGRGDFNNPAYASSLVKGKQVMNEALSPFRASGYADYLRLLQGLLVVQPDSYPFLKTAAYQDKMLLTSLAGWAGQRHIWELQTKESVTYSGLASSPAGWVEPYPDFFRGMQTLVNKTIKDLDGIDGIDFTRLTILANLAGALAAISEKQIRGQQLDKSDAALFASYPRTIADLAYFGSSSFLAPQRWLAFATPVHTAIWEDGQQQLMAAVGPAREVFVVIDAEGRKLLASGGIAAYYEIATSEGLDDTAWEGTVAAAGAPPMPEWTTTFSVGRDAAKVVEKIRAGELDPALAEMNDPRIAPALKEGLAPGGLLRTDPAVFARAVYLYGIKARKEAVPLLVQQFFEGALERWEKVIIDVTGLTPKELKEKEKEYEAKGIRFNVHAGARWEGTKVIPGASTEAGKALRLIISQDTAALLVPFIQKFEDSLVSAQTASEDRARPDGLGFFRQAADALNILTKMGQWHEQAEKSLASAYRRYAPESSMALRSFREDTAIALYSLGSRCFPEILSEHLALLERRYASQTDRQRMFVVSSGHLLACALGRDGLPPYGQAIYDEAMSGRPFFNRFTLEQKAALHEQAAAFLKTMAERENRKEPFGWSRLASYMGVIPEEVAAPALTPSPRPSVH